MFSSFMDILQTFCGLVFDQFSQTFVGILYSGFYPGFLSCTLFHVLFIKIMCTLFMRVLLTFSEVIFVQCLRRFHWCSLFYRVFPCFFPTEISERILCKFCPKLRKMWIFHRHFMLYGVVKCGQIYRHFIKSL